MAKTTNYQTLSRELDEVLHALQQPDVDIEAAVILYDRGLALIKNLEKHLTEAENKIETLKLSIKEG